MDETTQMVLGAIEKMDGKLDEVKDSLFQFVADARSQLATLNQWKRSTEDSLPALEGRVLRLENERVTQKAIDELKGKVEKQQEEIGKLKEQGAAISMKDKIQGAIVAALAAGIISLLAHFLSK